MYARRQQSTIWSKSATKKRPRNGAFTALEPREANRSKNRFATNGARVRVDCRSSESAFVILLISTDLQSMRPGRLFGLASFEIDPGGTVGPSPKETCRDGLFAFSGLSPLERDRGFESTFLQGRVCEPSVPESPRLRSPAAGAGRTRRVVEQGRSCRGVGRNRSIKCDTARRCGRAALPVFLARYGGFLPVPLGENYRGRK